MEEGALVRLERIARNMPVSDLAMNSVEAEHGVIYFAYGEAGDSTIHGIWGYRNIAQPIEFKPGTDTAVVRQVLVDQAADFINKLMAKADPRNEKETNDGEKPTNAA